MQMIKVNQGVGGDEIRTYDTARQAAMISGFKSASSLAREEGVPDASILIAIAEGRDAFDPFGMFCRTYGYMMRFFGSTITFVVSVLSLVCFLQTVAQSLNSFGEWIKRVIKDHFWLLMFAGAGTGLAAYLLRDEERKVNDADSINPVGMSELVLSFLPAPITVAFKMLSQSFGSGAGGMAPTPSATPNPAQTGYALGQAVASPIQTAAGVATGASTAIANTAIEAAKALWGWFTGKKDELSPAELDAIAHSTGENASTVYGDYDAVMRAADEEEEDNEPHYG